MTKYEKHYNKLNLVYEAYKNSKISLLEFLNKTTKNNNNMDILIDRVNSLLQKYTDISEILMNDDLSLSDDNIINELYTLSEMSDNLENQTLYYYNNINRNSNILNKSWKEHLLDIERERLELKNNNSIYYYSTISELLEHASLCFEIKKAELEYSIQMYLKNELIPQIDNENISDEEFMKYYKLISGLINDINDIKFPIIIEK